MKFYIKYKKIIFGFAKNKMLDFLHLLTKLKPT